MFFGVSTKFVRWREPSRSTLEILKVKFELKQNGWALGNRADKDHRPLWSRYSASAFDGYGKRLGG